MTNFLFFFLSPLDDNRDEWIGSSNGTRSCRFSWLKIILMALWNWTPSVAAVCKKRAKGKPPSKSDRVKITGSAFRQNNSTIWLRSWIFINFSLFDKGEKNLLWTMNFNTLRRHSYNTPLELKYYILLHRKCILCKLSLRSQRKK